MNSAKDIVCAKAAPEPADYSAIKNRLLSVERAVLFLRRSSPPSVALHEVDILARTYLLNAQAGKNFAHSLYKKLIEK